MHTNREPKSRTLDVDTLEEGGLGFRGTLKDKDPPPESFKNLVSKKQTPDA